MPSSSKCVEARTSGGGNADNEEDEDEEAGDDDGKGGACGRLQVQQVRPAEERPRVRVPASFDANLNDKGAGAGSEYTATPTMAAGALACGPR